VDDTESRPALRSGIAEDSTRGRLVKHARCYWLLLVEGHLNRRRFGAMLGRIALTAGTDGIDRWWSGRQRSLSTASWSKERCRKSGLQMTQFRLCWFGISYRRGRSG